MFSIAVTYKIGTFYVMPMVTFLIFLIFLIFLMFNVTLYDPSFFFWVGMYTVFSFIISYITILFVKGYKAVEKER